MNNLYRIKIEDRIIGPFTKEQVGELYKKNKISGLEDCQIFPAGDWIMLKKHNELSKVIFSIINENQLDLSDNTILSLEEDFQDKFSEFKFDNNENKEIINYKELELESSGVEKTKVINLNNKNKLEEKTRMVIRENHVDELTEEFETIAPEFIPKKEKSERFSDNKTEIFKIEEVIKDLNKEASKYDKNLNLSDKEKYQNITSFNKIKKDSKKRPLKPIVILTIIALIFFMLFDGKESEIINPRRIKVIYPIEKPTINEEQSIKYYKKGIIEYSKNTYENKLFAANNFKKSLEYKYLNNPSLGWLIVIYSELLTNAEDRTKAYETIFKLIQIGKSKQLKDININMGSAIFYSSIKKYDTAIMLMENYLRVSKPSLKFLVEYLRVLLKAEKLSKASQVKNRIEKSPKKTVDYYYVVSKFYLINENFKKAYNVLLEGLNVYPNSVLLLLEVSKYYLENKKYASFREALKTIKKRKAESSPTYYAKYLEYVGMLAGITGDTKTAINMFKIALKINESSELYSKLSALELGGNEAEEQLIRESKIINLMNQVKRYMKERKWNEAFSKAIEATDLSKYYIPSHLLLAKVKLKRGYFEEALKTIEGLRSNYPLNSEIYFSLIDTYIKIRKFNDAKREIDIMSNTTKLIYRPEYASILGDFYYLKGHILLSIQWYLESLKRNPVNDLDYYKLGKIFLRARKYNKSKYNILKAIFLDPLNIDYHSVYAQILYELEGSDSAIGYLRNLLKENKDNPKILAEIAIYYYKEGKVREFNEYLNKIKIQPKIDPTVYKFLVKVYKTYDDQENVIKYSRKLVEIDPSDVESMMTLGSTLLSNKKLDEAVEVFNSVKKRLSSYPKVHYFLAKIYMEKNDLDAAIKLGLLEQEKNKDIYHGYYIVGEIYRRKGQYSLASKNLEKAISIDRNSVESLFALGWIKMRQDHAEQARELYFRARNQDKNNPLIRRELGFVFRKIGQRILAIEEFETYLKLNPGAEDRKKIERYIRQLRK